MKKLNDAKYLSFIRAFPEHYTAEMILSKYNLLKDAVDLNEQFSLCCPFHDDVLPSFRIDKTTGMWHCFGCGVGGHLAKLLYMLDKTTIPMPYYFENFLKQDLSLQQSLGFSSLYYIDTTNSLDSFIKERKQTKFKYDKNSDMPLSLLISELKSQSCDFNSLSSSLEMLQAGLRSNEVLYYMKNINRTLNDKNKISEIFLKELIIEE